MTCHRRRVSSAVNRRGQRRVVHGTIRNARIKVVPGTRANTSGCELRSGPMVHRRVRTAASISRVILIMSNLARESEAIGHSAKAVTLSLERLMNLMSSDPPDCGVDTADGA